MKPSGSNRPQAAYCTRKNHQLKIKKKIQDEKMIKNGLQIIIFLLFIQILSFEILSVPPATATRFDTGLVPLPPRD